MFKISIDFVSSPFKKNHNCNYNKNGYWSWKIKKNDCGYCRTPINDLCNDCLYVYKSCNFKHSFLKNQCKAILCYNNHIFHYHCMSKYHKEHTLICPFDKTYFK